MKTLNDMLRISNPMACDRDKHSYWNKQEKHYIVVICTICSCRYSSYASEVTTKNHENVQGDYKKTIPTFGSLTIIPFTETEWNFSIRCCEVCTQE